jgi:hypothetical protein
MIVLAGHGGMLGERSEPWLVLNTVRHPGTESHLKTLFGELWITVQYD